VYIPVRIEPLLALHDAVLRQPIEVGSLDGRVAVTSQVTAHVVGDDHDDVANLVLSERGRRDERAAEQRGEHCNRDAHGQSPSR